MNKKIALVTCYFQHNYGSQLQAYATQLFFDKLHVANETICIDGFKHEIVCAKYKYFLSRIFDLNTIKDKWATVKKTVAKKINKSYSKRLGVRTKMYNDFSNSEFHLSTPYSSIASLSKSANKYSAFLVGSDQLWLPSNIAADYYTLNFVPKEIPKISLSTSFGISKLPTKQERVVKRFIPKIDFCSVRETSGQKIIKDLTGRNVPVVCDPTILLTAEEWNLEISSERFFKDEYMLCYFLGNNPKQRELVKKIKLITGLKIVQLQHCDEFIASDEEFPDFAPYNVGPKEFVRLIRDAEYIFTDSFHCSVFSMLYKKNFFTFRRYNNDSFVSTNGRIYSLLSLVNQENRLLTGNEAASDLLKMSIDYDLVHGKLSKLREFTKSFIYNALDTSQIKYDKITR